MTHASSPVAARATSRAALARRFLLACSAVVFLAAPARAQTAAPEQPRGQGAASPARADSQQAGATADESFDLDIPSRRITERNFYASTEVAAEGGAAVRVRVGAAVGAEEVEVLLRNVRGSVRFRANLEPVLRLLDARRGAGQSPPDGAPSPRSLTP